MKRPVRLGYPQRLLYRNPVGYRSSEPTRLCGVDQRTISRDLADLQSEPFYLPLVQDDEWRWRLVEGHRFTLPPIQFSLQGAAALLGRAWGITYGEGQAEVVVRFTPAVARRVGETVWHARRSRRSRAGAASCGCGWRTPWRRSRGSAAGGLAASSPMGRTAGR